MAVGVDDVPRGVGTLARQSSWGGDAFVKVPQYKSCTAFNCSRGYTMPTHAVATVDLIVFDRRPSSARVCS